MENGLMRKLLLPSSTTLQFALLPLHPGLNLESILLQLPQKRSLCHPSPTSLQVTACHLESLAGILDQQGQRIFLLQGRLGKTRKMGSQRPSNLEKRRKKARSTGHHCGPLEGNSGQSTAPTLMELTFSGGRQAVNKEAGNLDCGTMSRRMRT
ncbi:coiled-coil domain-containing protein 12 isoform X2 [Sapajus apella]|uniref:Coiled-coil domain-containing protein 12 isoform X2 n=1 Tax=Sapajus apella TaxID=9515 RepID=A0A6J3JH82_SAPAP|nr:coiled-coil domain-containing protein 12 isoform X2 [Sapajus apella]